MYHVSAQGLDERMINVHYYYMTDRALESRYMSYLLVCLWKHSSEVLCPPGCLEEWPSDHTYRYPHSFSERATKSEKRTGKSRLVWYYVWHLPSPEDSCGYTALSWTRRSQGKWPSRSLDWREKQPSQAWENLKCWEAWDTACGHKAKDITASIGWRRET